MNEKRSKIPLLLKGIIFILFGGIVLLMYLVTDGISDSSDLFTEFFSRRKNKEEKTDAADE